MKVQLSGFRANVELEGSAIDILLDLAELKAPTLEGKKLLEAFEKEYENNQTVVKSDYPLESDIELSYVLRPFLHDFIIVIKLLNNGEYLVNSYSDTNSYAYIRLYNLCNGKK